MKMMSLIKTMVLFGTRLSSGSAFAKGTSVETADRFQSLKIVKEQRGFEMFDAIRKSGISVIPVFINKG
jgi:hypothetical protein